MKLNVGDVINYLSHFEHDAEVLIEEGVAKVKALAHHTRAPVGSIEEGIKAISQGEKPYADVSQPAAVLRNDGPTLAEWVQAGYPADKYPPPGYAKRE